jgi:hypothetical protein
LVHGLKLAKEVKARVTIVTVTPPWSALDLAHEARLRKPDPIHQFEEMAAASAKVILDVAAKTAKMAGVSCELVHVPDQHPADGIIATAEKNGCDLIRPLVIAIVLGFLGAVLSAIEEAVPLIGTWIPEVLFPSRQGPQVAQTILSAIATSIMTVVSIVLRSSS